jgi:hypothetical protein
LFLVDGLEQCKWTTVRSSEEVAATGAFIGQLRVVPLAKSVFNLYYFFEIICRLYTFAVLLSAFAKRKSQKVWVNILELVGGLS